MATRSEPEEKLSSEVPLAVAEDESTQLIGPPNKGITMLNSAMVSGNSHEARSSVDYVTAGIDQIKQLSEQILSILKSPQQHQQQLLAAGQGAECDPKLYSMLTELDKKVQQFLKSCADVVTREKELSDVKAQVKIHKHNEQHYKTVSERLDVENKRYQDKEERNMKQTEVLQKKNEELKDKNHELSNGNEKLKAKNGELKNEKEKQESENKKLKSENEKLKSKNEGLESKLKQTQGGYSSYAIKQEEKVAAQKTEIDELKTKIDKVNAENESLKQRMSDKEKEITDLKCNLAGLRSSIEGQKQLIECHKENVDYHRKKEMDATATGVRQLEMNERKTVTLTSSMPTSHS